MGKANRGPFGFDELTSTLATTSAGSRSDHPTSRISNFTGVNPVVCPPGWLASPAALPFTPNDAYDGTANASGGGNGAACGAAVEFSDADVDGVEASGEAPS